MPPRNRAAIHSQRCRTNTLTARNTTPLARPLLSARKHRSHSPPSPPCPEPSSSSCSRWPSCCPSRHSGCLTMAWPPLCSKPLGAGRPGPRQPVGSHSPRQENTGGAAGEGMEAVGEGCRRSTCTSESLRPSSNSCWSSSLYRSASTRAWSCPPNTSTLSPSTEQECLQRQEGGTPLVATLSQRTRRPTSRRCGSNGCCCSGCCCRACRGRGRPCQAAASRSRPRPCSPCTRPCPPRFMFTRFARLGRGGAAAWAGSVYQCRPSSTSTARSPSTVGCTWSGGVGWLMPPNSSRAGWETKGRCTRLLLERLCGMEPLTSRRSQCRSDPAWGWGRWAGRCSKRRQARWSSWWVPPPSTSMRLCDRWSQSEGSWEGGGQLRQGTMAAL
mmetsp:Transcript_16088/g.21976  ORF Transcript_16088/g.21976 Transcript_16088/m.21976 type:complete len:385 (-) Transcript_16088:3112-4266(-)